MFLMFLKPLFVHSTIQHKVGVSVGELVHKLKSM